MLGRGKGSAADKDGKDGKRRKRGKSAEGDTPDEGPQTAAEKARAAEEKAREAAERAAEAEEEAARLARLAAEAEDAVKSPETDQGAQEDVEPPSGDEKGSADDSVDSAGGPVDSEDESEGDSEEDDEDESEEKDERPSLRKAPKSETDGDDGDDGDEDVEEVEDEPVRSSGRRPVVYVGVLAVLAIALAAGTTFLGLQVAEDGAADDARRDGVAAASQAVRALSSYDHRTLDNDLKAAEAATTGELREEFPKFAEELKAEAKQQEAVSTTTVLKAGAVSASPDEVVVLVYANRIAATNKDAQARLPEPLRIKTTMVKVDGEWKAGRLEVLS